MLGAFRKGGQVLLLVSSVAFLTPSLASAQSAAELRELIEEQQRQMEEQAQRLEAMQERLEELEVEQAATRETAETAASTAESVAAEPLVTSGTSKVELAISGQINRMANIGYDGDKTKYYNVDNDNSSSRLRFVGTGRPNEEVTIGSVLEIEITPNKSTEVSQENEDIGGSQVFNDRKAEVSIAHESFGTVTIGKGSTASDGTSEVDVSGTTVIAYSDIQKTAGGLLWYDSDNDEYSDTTIGDVFNNLDGLSRRDRVRYDTPDIGGFGFAIDAISDQRWSSSLRWGGDFANLKAAAAIAYSDPGGDRKYLYDGSVSVLHTPTGLSLTLSGGVRDEDGRDDSFNTYAKLGWLTEFFSFGTTAFALDYTNAENFDENNDEANSVGAYVVQNVSDWGIEFYGGYRWHTLDRDNTDFDDIHVVSVGTRVKF